MVNGLPITLSSTRDPTEIPWKDTGVRAAQWLARTLVQQLQIAGLQLATEDGSQAPLQLRLC